MLSPPREKKHIRVIIAVAWVLGDQNLRAKWDASDSSHNSPHDAIQIFPPSVSPMHAAESTIAAAEKQKPLAHDCREEETTNESMTD